MNLIRDINDIILVTKVRTGLPEEVVDKIIRSMFADIQKFTSKKKGYCIQIPNIGTMYFRVNSIPGFVSKQKSYLAHWISRLIIGETRMVTKTIEASKRNIDSCFYKLKQVSTIKQEFLNEHATYKARTKARLEADYQSDLQGMDEYIDTIKGQLFLSPGDTFQTEDL